MSANLAPPPPLRNTTLILYAHYKYLKLSECEDVSIIIIIQVRFCLFRGWGKLSRAVYLAPLPRTCITKVKIWMFIPLFPNISESKDASLIFIIQVNLRFFSTHSLIHLAAGVGVGASSLSCPTCILNREY